MEEISKFCVKRTKSKPISIKAFLKMVGEVEHQYQVFFDIESWEKLYKPIKRKNLLEICFDPNKMWFKVSYVDNQMISRSKVIRLFPFDLEKDGNLYTGKRVLKQTQKITTHF